MRKTSILVNIPLRYLDHHPDNPRKDLGDLTELIESVKANGIIQNLSVVSAKDPIFWRENVENYTEASELEADIEDMCDVGEFYVMIGNRRYEAAKEAGLDSVPCRIEVGLTKADQVSIMLEENLQRKDLTIPEQAYGFQQLIDLGESVEKISEKTGFSRSTIYGRLNIAKLPRELVEDAVNNYQITLADLQSLEKIEDVKKRNDVLKQARDSRDFANRVRVVVREQEEKKNENNMILMCKHKGIKKAPKEVENEYWTNKWDTLSEWDLSGKLPKTIKIKNANGRELFYFSRYGRFKILAKAEKKKKELSPQEIKDREGKQIGKEVKEKLRIITDDMQDFVRGIIDGKIKPVRDTGKIIDMLWKILIRSEAYLSKKGIKEVLLGKDVYSDDVTDEDREALDKKADDLSTLHQMMATALYNIKDISLLKIEWDYDSRKYIGMFCKDNAEMIEMMSSTLAQYGWSFPDDESMKLAYGEHELIKKFEELYK